MSKLVAVAAFAAIAAAFVVVVGGRSEANASGAGDPRIAVLQKQVKTLQTEVKVLTADAVEMHGQVHVGFTAETCLAAQTADLLAGHMGGRRPDRAGDPAEDLLRRSDPGQRLRKLRPTSAADGSSQPSRCATDDQQPAADHAVAPRVTRSARRDGTKVWCRPFGLPLAPFCSRPAGASGDRQTEAAAALRAVSKVAASPATLHRAHTRRM